MLLSPTLVNTRQPAVTQMAERNINECVAVQAWQSTAEDLSRLESGRLKRSAIKCSTANVASILVETQHRPCLNYLNT